AADGRRRRRARDGLDTSDLLRTARSRRDAAFRERPSVPAVCVVRTSDAGMGSERDVAADGDRTCGSAAPRRPATPSRQRASHRVADLYSVTASITRRVVALLGWDVSGCTTWAPPLITTSSTDKPAARAPRARLGIGSRL